MFEVELVLEECTGRHRRAVNAVFFWELGCDFGCSCARGFAPGCMTAIGLSEGGQEHQAEVHRR